MIEQEKLCECGCGRIVKSGMRFIHGHNRKGYKLTEDELRIKSERVTEYYKTHTVSDETKKKQSDIVSERFKNNPMTDEHKKKISDSLIGKIVTDETRKRLSDSAKGNNLGNTNASGRRNTDTCKKMSTSAKDFYATLDDPGQQLVTHHYIYDFNDLDKYTIEVTRSEHCTIHFNLRYAGLEVPHINILKEEL